MDKTAYLKIKDELPAISGVYTFRDKARRPLYIGKAKNLANRVRSYFHGPKVPMIASMLQRATSLTWQETLSDIEALILESQLIKKYHPPFNTLLRDDKQYFYVGFTKDKFPRLIITHQPQKDRLISVGPFTDGGALKLALKSLRRIFPYCTCKQKHLNYCLNYHIGNCVGFCCLKNSNPSVQQSNDYKKNIQNIKDILSGKKKTVINNLLRGLKNDEKDSDFETLTMIQNKISKIQKFFLNTKVINSVAKSNKLILDLNKYLKLTYMPVRIEGYDISNINGLFATGSMVVFTNGQADSNEYRKFKIKTVLQSNDTAMLQEILTRRLKHTEWQSPDLILIDGGKGQVNAVTSVLKELDMNIPVVGLIKNEKHIGERLLLSDGSSIVSLSSLPSELSNLLLSIDSEAHRFAIQYYRKRHSLVTSRPRKGSK